MTAMGEKLLQSMREAVAYAKGEAGTEDYRVHAVSVDVREIRKKLKMTQKHFAQEFGFSLDTLRHWEQKRRTPEGPARAYLLVISQNPDAVRTALQSAAQTPPPTTSPKGVPAASA
ncbi:helix-turn-helix domain-containing protein [Desulfovibrio sp. TomC]|uniref:helix-turn-helix domain-containing protein n=1 Tax=Desulfovibrio sp. TomC TaxID=1562888 RepID=UPI000574E8A7|nr:helix-turn-helix domain-containing protein [Desulfovibrio sp. TomC]KHK03676.1 DNA-binding protein [Desulfovibrio sp. TomC]